MGAITVCFGYSAVVTRVSIGVVIDRLSLVDIVLISAPVFSIKPASREEPTVTRK